MCWRTVSKNARTLYFRSCFILTTINPLETAGLDKILDIFAASIGTLQMHLLILQISPLT